MELRLSLYKGTQYHAAKAQLKPAAAKAPGDKPLGLAHPYSNAISKLSTLFKC